MATVNTAGCPSEVAPSDMTCAQRLRSLYDAYFRLISGASVATVQSADFRRMDMTPGDIPAIKAEYALLYASCGASTGLPDINASTGRGGPAAFGCR